MATAHPAIAAHAQTVTAAIALNAWAASPLMVSLSIPKAPLSLPPRGGLPCKPLPAMGAWYRLSPSRAACKPPPVSALQRPSCGHRAPCTALPCLCGRHPRCCWRGTPHSIPLAARPGSCRGLGSQPCTSPLASSSVPNLRRFLRRWSVSSLDVDAAVQVSASRVPPIRGAPKLVLQKLGLPAAERARLQLDLDHSSDFPPCCNFAS